MAPCAGLTVLMILLANRGLESAAANGDTRTLTMHHLHTDEDITVTYKRDGRYDEEALKKLDYFLRDWRKNESIHMDPRLFDVVWEVSRDVGKDKLIEVVCGYRSPSTNEMLRNRSRASGVAQFSQHTLGKAIDFYIQGASLEEIREAGLRLQRGGVGYYPTSGSPFVHLDVGSVRHWPRMTREQLVRVFPDGRTVHVPSDGQPLPGYAQALAEIQRRGSSPPSQMSLAAAQLAGVDTSSVHSGLKGLFASLFHTDDEEEDAQAAAAPATATASAPRTFSLASVESKAAAVKAAPVRAASTASSQRTALAAVVASTGDASATAPGEHDPWATVGFTEVASRPAEIHAPMSNPDSAPAVSPWPIRDADKDHVPLDMVLAYATKPQHDGSVTTDAAGPEPARAAPDQTRSVEQSNTAGESAAAAAANKSAARTPGGLPTVTVIKVVVVTATPGMHYDDPWLRAMIMAPRLFGAMTATPYGEPDLTELKNLMSKPTAALAISFSNDPYPGIKVNSFSGEAIAQLTTITFSQRTAWLQ